MANDVLSRYIASRLERSRALLASHVPVVGNGVEVWRRKLLPAKDFVELEARVIVLEVLLKNRLSFATHADLEKAYQLMFSAAPHAKLLGDSIDSDLAALEKLYATP